jgi:succinate dehydrogenase/fumarate reductase flavoprotein subunit
MSQMVIDQWDRHIDVLIAGGGGAGLSAAVFCAQQGLSVEACEASSLWGGTTATSAGTLWVPGNHVARRAGIEEPGDAARQYLTGELGDRADPTALAMVDAFLEAGPLAVAALEEAGLQFVAPMLHPDYHTTPGAARAGRAIGPVAFDGRKLGKDFASIRPPLPSFLVLGGMMVDKKDIDHLLTSFRKPASFVHATKLLLGHVASRLRHKRGTRLVMGNALVAGLLFAARQHGVKLSTNTRIETLVLDAGRVVGVVVRNGQGLQRIGVKRGVILATGGFSHDRSARAELIGEPAARMLSLTFNGARGDGLRLARRHGGAVDMDMAQPSYYMPTSVRVHGGRDKEIFPHIFLDRAKPGLLAINSSGERFVNEANCYHDFISALLASPGHDPERPAYLICDESFLRRYGLGLIHPQQRNWQPFLSDGYLIREESVAQLAKKLEVDPTRLTKTIARYNDLAARGDDLDFGRGSTPLNQFNGDAANRPNPCLRPLGGSPYYSVAVWPADAGMAVGIKASRNAEVLNDQGEAIEGLYACGNDMGSVMRGNYPGPGITLGPAVTFAYRAARHLAGRALR